MRYFLSFPSWLQLAQSIQLGVPAASQPGFLVESAFERIRPEARDSAREALGECECIQAQIKDARSRFKVLEVGEIKLNPGESDKLRTELLWWVTRLADVLGVVTNPYAQMIYNGIANIGGINARVVS